MLLSRNMSKKVGESRQLTLKVTVLLLLMSGQRGQTIWLLDTRDITLSESEVRWRSGDLIKISNLKNLVDKLVFAAYRPDRRLCAVTYVKAYLNRTALLRGKETGFLIVLKSRTTKYQGVQSDAGSKLFVSSLE